MGQMVVESVGSEACIERCWFVTPQNGVLVIDKGWTREKECRRQQAVRRRLSSVYPQDAREFGVL